MKNVSTKSKIILVILILVIAAGVTMVVLKGFNFDLKNKASKRIELYIEKEFEVSDIKQMTNEVFENKEVLIQKVEVFEDEVSIISEDITEEQRNKMVEKINEKYGTKLKTEDVEIEDIPHTKFRDIIKPYILPIVLATAVIVLYSGIKYYKLGVIKSILKVGAILVLAEATLFSIMALTRLPIGRFTLPLVLFVYLVTMLGISTNMEKKLAENTDKD